MPFEVKGYIPSVKPGAYQATVLTVEEKSAKDDPTNTFRVWDFMITDGSQRSVSGSSSLSTSPKSKGGKWLRAILGRDPVDGEVVAPEGMPCTIIVAIKEATGYEYVEMVTAPEAARTVGVITKNADIVVPQTAPEAPTARERADDALPF